MDYWELKEKQTHDIERDAQRHADTMERQRIAADQRERLKEIERETRLILDQQQWSRKPEEYQFQHQALLDKLTAELQYIEIELETRRDDLALCHLLRQIDEQITLRRDLIKHGWSLLMTRLFAPGQSGAPSHAEADAVLAEEFLKMMEPKS